MNVSSVNGYYWVKNADASGTQPGYDYYFLIAACAYGTAVQLAFAYMTQLTKHRYGYRLYCNDSWSIWLAVAPD